MHRNPQHHREDAHTANHVHQDAHRSPSGRERRSAEVLQRTQADPASLRPADVLTLQRTIGNRATARLLRPVLQTRLQLGPVDDPYEREADRVAEQVVRRIDSTPATTTRQPQVQRDETETEDQRQTQPLADDLTPVRPTPAMRRSFVVRRDAQAEEQPLHGPRPKGTRGVVEQSVQQQIQAARGGGQPLPDSVCRQMESGFGANLSRVRIHTGERADTLNRSLNAKAFTVGSDVFFRRGAYDPQSSGGKTLLAHELTHTMQQSGSDIQKVQRALWTKDEFKKNTNAGTFARRSNKILLSIDRLLDQYHDPKNQSNRMEILQTLYNSVQSWIQAKEYRKSKTKTFGFLPTSSGKKTSSRRKGVKELLVMVQEEMDQLQQKKSAEPMPTGVGVGAVPDDPIPNDLSETEEDAWKLTLGVHRESKDYILDFIGENLPGGISSREFGTGHTWIVLSSYVKGKRRARYSYGFWPKVAFALTSAVPGVVMNPDKEHEATTDSELSEGNRYYMDYNLSKQQYETAWERARRLYRARPDYHLFNYNCTTFAADVMKSAGLSFPIKKRLNPSVLFSAMDQKNKKKTTTGEDKPYQPQKIEDRDIRYLLRDVSKIHEEPGKPAKFTAKQFENQKAIVEIVDPYFPNHKGDEWVTLRIRTLKGFRDSSLNHFIRFRDLQQHGAKVREQSIDDRGDRYRIADSDDVRIGFNDDYSVRITGKPKHYWPRTPVRIAAKSLPVYVSLDVIEQGKPTNLPVKNQEIYVLRDATFIQATGCVPWSQTEKGPLRYTEIGYLPEVRNLSPLPDLDATKPMREVVLKKGERLNLSPSYPAVSGRWINNTRGDRTYFIIHDPAFIQAWQLLPVKKDRGSAVSYVKIDENLPKEFNPAAWATAQDPTPVVEQAPRRIKPTGPMKPNRNGRR